MKTRPTLRGAPALGLIVLTTSCGGSGSPSEDGQTDAASDSPATPAGQLVARSVAFHDPDGVWGSREIAMKWQGTNAGGGERVAVDIVFGEDESDFSLSGRYAGSTIEYETTDDDWSASVDGTPEPELTPEVREAMRLHREDGMFWRSYYGFLAGLPMKIVDPGAHLEPDVIETTFLERDVHAVKVTYDPDVGGDTWYFYFDPETAEMVGCRFYHDESANDGEYITFESLSEGGGLKLPRFRAWYVNEDGRHLGSDEVREIEVR